MKYNAHSLQDVCQTPIELSRLRICRDMPIIQSYTCRSHGSRSRHSALRAASTSQAASAATTRTLEAKRGLLEAISEVPNTGVYGVQEDERQRILSLVEALEAGNPLHAPTEHLDRVHGTWRLLFSTITILGRRRVKLGLRNIVNIGELTQQVDTETHHSVNTVNFDILVFGTFKGSLTIEASYRPVGPQRVAITFERASLVPAQFQQLFEKNYDLLLSIFNPEGWLDITYVDEQHRIGRDDKGNVFVLERV